MQKSIKTRNSFAVQLQLPWRSSGRSRIPWGVLQPAPCRLPSHSSDLGTYLACAYSLLHPRTQLESLLQNILYLCLSPSFSFHRNSLHSDNGILFVFLSPQNCPLPPLQPVCLSPPPPRASRGLQSIASRPSLLRLGRESFHPEGSQDSLSFSSLSSTWFYCLGGRTVSCYG